MLHVIFILFVIRNTFAFPATLSGPILDKTVPFLHKMNDLIQKHKDEELWKYFDIDTFIYNTACQFEDLSLEVLFYYILTSTEKEYKLDKNGNIIIF